MAYYDIRNLQRDMTSFKTAIAVRQKYTRRSLEQYQAKAADKEATDLDRDMARRIAARQEATLEALEHALNDFKEVFEEYEDEERSEP